jgi:hypothetical protein
MRKRFARKQDARRHSAVSSARIGIAPDVDHASADFTLIRKMTSAAETARSNISRPSYRHTEIKKSSRQSNKLIDLSFEIVTYVQHSNPTDLFSH